jgi:hypothetical protein
MEVTSEHNLDSDALQEQIQIATDEISIKALRERVEGILNLTRLTTGLHLFFASHIWNPLGLAPGSVAACKYTPDDRLLIG